MDDFLLGGQVFGVRCFSTKVMGVWILVDFVKKEGLTFKDKATAKNSKYDLSYFYELHAKDYL